MIDKIRQQMKKRRIRLAIMLLEMSILPVVILGALITSLEQYNLKKNVKAEIFDELRSAAYAIEAAYDAVGNGDFIMLESGAVIKGTYVVTNNYAILDKLQKESGIYSSVYYMNKNVITSLKDADGNSLAGTYMKGDMERLVISEGVEHQVENLSIGDDTYYGFFLPLRTEDGDVTGAIFTGKKTKEIDTAFSVNMGTMVSISLLMCLVAVVYTLLMVTRVIRFVYVLFKDEETIEEMKNANKAKSDFLAHMSHEIRTPINAVLGMNEIILRENKDKNIAGYALNIKSAGQTLLALVNDILDFSKIEAGGMDIICADYDVTSLINDSYNLIAMRAKDKGLAVYVKNNENIPRTLYGDETRVRQVFTNLLTNAVKYTREGSVTIDVDCEPIDELNVLLKLSVTDTGIGIKEDDKLKLFNSFQRVDEEKNKNIEGTGLGLAITKELVDLMNGTLSVESEYGKGSTFSFAVKQGIINREPMGKFSYDNMKPVTDLCDYHELFRAPEARILVVDDAPMNLEVIVGLLKETGICVDTLSSGSECLEIIQMVKYDVIFLDHMMPEMDGVETLRRMKELRGYPNEDTPVIALTANAVVGAREEYIGYGFDDYLSKPIQSLELEKTVLKYIPEELVEYSSEENEKSSEVVNFAKEINHAQSASVIMPGAGNDLLGKMNGILDTTVGLSYCGTEDLYKEIIGTYAFKNSYSALLDYYKAEDYENYRITIHSVKSTSLYIGATEMSDRAKALEEAIKEDDIEYVKEHHEETMTVYKDLLDKLKTLLE